MCMKIVLLSAFWTNFVGSLFTYLSITYKMIRLWKLHYVTSSRENQKIILIG